MNDQMSLTFRVLNKIGLIHDSQKYGKITILGFFIHFVRLVMKEYRFKICYRPGIFETYWCKHLRTKLWRKMGCAVGEKVFIGHSVALDIGNTDKIIIEDKVSITNGCILLAHKKDISDYCKYDDSYNLPFVYKPIVLKKGCQIGMGSIIMPGVTVGEGAIIAARSVVTKDIPAWTVAAGIPCKVIKQINERKI